MGSAAEFDRMRTGLEHLDDIAVFVPEERDCTEFLSGGLRGLEMMGRVVGEDVDRDEILDTTNLVVGHRLVVTEVESEAIGSDL